ncbi:MAG: RagB/SusD family nutrient uptake outer membrane protein [Gemmatimonadaceae bacterium]
MMTTIRQTRAPRAGRRRRVLPAALGALFLAAACDGLDIQNLNAPTAETLTGNPTREVLARAAIGIQVQNLNDVGGIIQQWGIYGREGYNLLGNDPRETGEEIRGPQDAGGRAGGVWGGQYQAIRTINTYQKALENAQGLTATEVKAASGFSKTSEAWHLHTLAVRSGPTGIPIDVDRSIGEDPAPLVAMATAMEAASKLLDEGYAELQAGGTSFPFAFVPGYTGFTTPAAFAKFNRGLAAKVLVHRATFANCTACWAQAATAIGQSFINPAGSLSTGVYYGYTGAAGEPGNPVTEGMTSNRYWVHPSIVTGAQLRADGSPDLRLTANTAKAASPRTLNELTSQYKPVMYNTTSLAANPDADIPWLTNEELILLRAEIRWNTNDRAGAIADLNTIRQTAGGLPATTLTPASSNDAFVTELLYNRLMSLMWTQGTRWIDARRYGRLATLPRDRAGDVVHPNMLIPAAECDARRLPVPCSM